MTDLQFRLEWLALRALILLAHVLPAEFCIRASGWIWMQVAPMLKRHLRAEAHLARALPDLSEAQRTVLLREMWRNLGMTFAEALMLGRLARDPSRMVFRGDSPALVLAARSRPTVFASLHMGNWEALSWAAMLRDVTLCGVYQKVRNPYVERLLRQSREPFYPGGLLPKGPAAARNMIRALAKGMSVAIMADLRELGGIPVPFLGRLAPSTPFPATLSCVNGYPLIAARAVRLAPGRFALDLVEVPVARTGDRQADIVETTRALHSQFEAWVRENPEQWMWAHRRYER